MSGPLDSEELEAVVPAEIETYLVASGWNEIGRYPRSSVWVRDIGGDGADVRLPTNRHFRDYTRRIAEILGTLSAVEGRERGSILRDIRTGGVDVQHIRTMPDGPSGTTPLHQGFLAVQGVHDLFLAAATSANLQQREAVLPPKPQPVWDFAKQVRFGQTAPGSYVLRVETPLTAGEDAGFLDSRRVLRHLHSAVQSAHTAASQSLADGSAAFEDHVSGGVSANLCEALSYIGDRGSCEFEMGFDWARARPFDEPTPPLHFNTGLIGELKRGGEHLRALSEREQVVVEGRVVELRRHKLSGSGRVLVDGSVRTNQGSFRDEVVVLLPGEHYDRAIRAHGTDRRITVHGSARLSKRQKEMFEVSLVLWTEQ